MFHVEHWSWGRRIGKGGALEWERIRTCALVKIGESASKRMRASEQGRALDFRVGAGICARSGGELLKNYDAARV